ncbi:hypothetical protein E5161_07115 [Cohnella pontilimi]|uniref:Uncharacterized protein n=1 Tax=Cohnella pontilimi TaxID=2564100 RepID=A0A4U0FCK8_9BACL|nr:hypothetical protein [Cohnella pontilimi]TJY42616.1 hypothetical protein E5161_07115 [Cohnella pontilimi]
MIVYDNRFNTNEWFIIGGLCVGMALVIFLPKRFPTKNTIVYFMCGVYSGFFFDHSLSVEPVSYYDVNDKSAFQFMDFLSYLSYGPMSYLFFYIYDRIRPKPSHIPLYILIWSLTAVGLEWLAVRTGVFHYLHGYKLAYSFPIYLIVQSCWIAFFHRYHNVRSNERDEAAR